MGLVLRVVIDRPLERDAQGRIVVERPEQSIGIEDCQRVSQDLSAILDVEDALDAAYTLEVSSPGLERSLRDADGLRAVRRPDGEDRRPRGGRADRCTSRAGFAESKTARWCSRSGRQKVVRLPLDNIARGRLAVEF